MNLSFNHLSPSIAWFKSCIRCRSRLLIVSRNSCNCSFSSASEVASLRVHSEGESVSLWCRLCWFNSFRNSRFFDLLLSKCVAWAELIRVFVGDHIMRGLEIKRFNWELSQNLPIFKAAINPLCFDWFKWASMEETHGSNAPILWCVKTPPMQKVSLQGVTVSANCAPSHSPSPRPCAVLWVKYTRSCWHVLRQINNSGRATLIPSCNDLTKPKPNNQVITWATLIWSKIGNGIAE